MPTRFHTREDGRLFVPPTEEILQLDTDDLDTLEAAIHVCIIDASATIDYHKSNGQPHEGASFVLAQCHRGLKAINMARGQSDLTADETSRDVTAAMLNVVEAARAIVAGAAPRDELFVAVEAYEEAILNR